MKYTGIPNNSGLYQTNIIINSGATLEMNVPASTVNNFGAFNRYLTGAGTLNKTGAGNLDLGGYGGNCYIDFSPGALIHVSGGTLQGAHYGVAGTSWAGNYASLTLDGNTVFDMNYFSAQVDALNWRRNCGDYHQLPRLGYAVRRRSRRQRRLRGHDPKRRGHGRIDPVEYGQPGPYRGQHVHGRNDD